MATLVRRLEVASLSRPVVGSAGVTEDYYSPGSRVKTSRKRPVESDGGAGTPRPSVVLGPDPLDLSGRPWAHAMPVVLTKRKSNGLSRSVADAGCNRQSPILGWHTTRVAERPAE